MVRLKVHVSQHVSYTRGTLRLLVLIYVDLYVADPSIPHRDIRSVGESAAV
jgi:hypothetical protein